MRHPDDFYETPGAAIRPLLAKSPWDEAKRPLILEPMAGRGAIVRELRAKWPNARIVACELDAERASRLRDAGADDVIEGDLFASRLPLDNFDLVVSNPAFCLATETIAFCRARSVEASFLQRLNFLGSQDRAPFWRANPCRVDIIPKRPSFAASLKCPKKKECGWAVTQLLEEPRAKLCPQCGAKVTCTTSDSCEYSWFTWGPGIGASWSILSVGEAA